MDDQLDSYYKWFGIPPEEQPPNHYRLLGLEVYESDPDVISNAINRVMMYLRTHQLGKYSKLSTKLLSEVANAKICLLDANKKKKYDAKL